LVRPAAYVILLAAMASACSNQPIISGDSNALNAQGVAYVRQGKYGAAEPLLQRALAVRQATLGADRPALGDSFYNLGWLYRLEGRYADAEPLLMRSLAIMEKSQGPENRLVAQHLTELATVYLLEGRYTDAEPLYRRALAIKETLAADSDPSIAITLNDLGYLCALIGRYAEAESLYLRALAIRQKMLGATDISVAVLLTNLGNLMALQGRLTEAERLTHQALDIRRRDLGPDNPNIAESLTDLGNVEFAQRRYGDAEAHLRQGVAIWESSLGQDYPPIATRGLGSLAKLYQSQGRTDEAGAASARAVAILERHLTYGAGSRSVSVAAERRIYRGDFLDAIALSYASGTAQGPRDGMVGATFQIAQFAVASTAGQAVAGMAARFASGNDALAATVRQRQDLNGRWQQLDAEILKAASASPSDRNAADEAALRRQQDDVSQQLDLLEARTARDFPAYATLTSPKPVSLPAAQAMLAPDETMLVYLVGHDVTWLWALDRARSAIYRIDLGEAALAAEVAGLRARLDPWQNPDLKPFPARRAFTLYQKIMAPAAGFLQGARNVLLVPDGALQSLPMGVLVTQPPRSDPLTNADHRGIAWLAKDHAVSILPAVGSLQALRSFASPSRASLPFTGIGNPDLAGPPGAAAPRGSAPPHVSIRQADLFRGGAVDVGLVRELPPLPETAIELRTIARALGATEDNLYLGKRAREPLLRTAGLDRYRIVEFATHGLMSGDLGLGEPALVLTPPDTASGEDDGLLTASKIATLKFDADWVVLSACNTAASDGTPDAGGLSGLAKAFFYAGARSLLVSHWSVPSIATVKLTTGAFAELAKEPAIGRSEALRRSMMAMLDPSNPAELSHPMAWAPFVLAGEGGAQANVRPPP
jgi:CHAT domain-containing protein/Flp pilus assembly protein TadD